MATVANLVVRVSANVTDFEKAMGGLEKSFARTGAKVQSVGANLTKGFTLPLAGFGLAAGKAAMDFESSFAGVKKTVNATDQEFAKLSQGLRDMAKAMPVNVNELNKIAESAGQLGIGKDDILAFTEVMAKLGETTNLSSDQAATSIAQIQNIYNASGKETSNFASSLVALGNAGASTEADIVEMAGRIAGAANQLGISQADTLGFASALANLGINAEAGGSAISRVMSSISVAVDGGGEKLAQFAEVAGMSSTAYAALFKTDASAAITAFVDGLGKAKDSGANLTSILQDLGQGDIRVMDALKRMAGAGDQLRNSLDLAKSSWQENSALTEEYQKRAATTASQLGILWNKIYDVGIVIGTSMLPMLKEMVKWADPVIGFVSKVVEGFTALPLPLQGAAFGLLGLVAAAGPVIYIAGTLISSWGSVAGALKLGSGALGSLGLAVPGVSTAFSGLFNWLGKLVPLFGSWGGLVRIAGMAFGVLTGPLGLTVTAVGLLAPALYTAVGGWDGIKSALSGLGGILSSTWGFLKDITTIVLHLGGEALSILGGAFSSVGGYASKFYDGLNTYVIGPLTTFGGMVLDVTGISTAFRRIGEGAQWAGDQVKMMALDIENAKFVADSLPALQKTADANMAAMGMQPLKPMGIPSLDSGGVMGSGLPGAHGAGTPATGAKTGGKKAKEELSEFERGVRSLTSSFTDSIDKAYQWVEAVARFGGIDKLTKDGLANFTKSMVDAVETMRAMGQEAPRTWALIADTQTRMAGLQGDRDFIAESMKGVGIKRQDLYIPGGERRDFGLLQAPSLAGVVQGAQVSGQQAAGMFKQGWTASMHDLPNVIQRAFQGGGSVVASVASMLGNNFAQTFSNKAGTMMQGFLGSKLGSSIGSILGPLGAALGPLIGAFVSKIGSKVWSGLQGLFGTDEEAKVINPKRDEFLQQFGFGGTGAGSGFANLAAKLTAVTGEAGGGALFESLMKADTLKEFTDSVAAITARLELAHVSIGALAADQEKLEQLRTLLYTLQTHGGSVAEIGMVQSQIDALQAGGSQGTAALTDLATANETFNMSLTGSDEAIAELGRTQLTVTDMMLQGFDKLIVKLDEITERLYLLAQAMGGLGTVPLDFGGVTMKTAPSVGDMVGAEVQSAAWERPAGYNPAIIGPSDPEMGPSMGDAGQFMGDPQAMLDRISGGNGRQVQNNVTVQINAQYVGTDEAWVRKEIAPRVLDAISAGGENFSNFESLVAQTSPA